MSACSSFASPHIHANVDPENEPSVGGERFQAITVGTAEVKLSDCWAKTDPDTGRPALTVRDHCLIVGAVAEALRDDMHPLVRSLLPDGAVTLAALHDTGKLTASFQLLIHPLWPSNATLAANSPLRREGSVRGFPHAAVSEVDLCGRLPRGARVLARAIGAHHGRFQQVPIPRDQLERSVFRAVRDELADAMIRAFGPLPDAPCNFDGPARLEFLAGFFVIADWLGSDEENFPLPAPEDFPPLAPMEREGVKSRAKVAAGRASQRFPDLNEKAGFTELFGFKPNALQRTALTTADRPGLHVIEAPMGLGKTEAALAIATSLMRDGQAAGFYFALPTQLTSNEIHRRIGNEFLPNLIEETAPLPLAHSASWLASPSRLTVRPSADLPEQGEHARAARHWFTRRKALLARFGAGTIDQALMATLPVKFHALRLFGLAGKVVILDEVHSYDAYTGTLLLHLIRRLLAVRATVIVLSATLDRQTRSRLIEAAGGTLPPPDVEAKDEPYPLITSVCNSSGVHVASVETDRSPLTVKLRHLTLEEPSLAVDLLEEIAGRVRDGACVLVLRNTVALAQETYRQLASRIPVGPGRGLLHSRFTFLDRFGDPSAGDSGGREAAWVAVLGKGQNHDRAQRPRAGCLLVATQVVEQSVDIDADLLVTDLAPTDMLIQRLGRLHRHPRWRSGAGSTAEAWILHPILPAADESNERAWTDALRPHGCIYAPWALLRTHALWRDHNAITLPNDIRNFVETTYVEDPGDPAAWRSLASAMREQAGKIADTADGFAQVHGRATGSDDEQRAPTRWFDQPTGELILLTAAPETLAGGKSRFSFHDGTTVEWHPAEPWSFPLAKAIFLNAVRLPAYRLGNTEPEAWLHAHSHGPVAAAFVNDGGALSWTDGNPAPFHYLPELGLIYDPERAPTRRDRPIPLPDEDFIL